MPIEKSLQFAVTAAIANRESERIGSTFGSDLYSAFSSANFQSTPCAVDLMASAHLARQESGTDTNDAASGDSLAIAADGETFDFGLLSHLEAPADSG